MERWKTWNASAGKSKDGGPQSGRFVSFVGAEGIEAVKAILTA